MLKISETSPNVVKRAALNFSDEASLAAAIACSVGSKLKFAPAILTKHTTPKPNDTKASRANRRERFLEDFSFPLFTLQLYQKQHEKLFGPYASTSLFFVKVEEL